VSSFAGTGRLIRLALRRDRVRLPVWVFAIGFSLLGSVASFAQAYPTAADRQARAAVLDQAVARLFVGPGYGSEHYTYGAMTANELLPSAAIAVALMSIFLVIRHTRAEEESGTAELVRATAVGRHAPIASTLVVVGGAQVLLFAILAAGLPASLESLSSSGSLAFAGALLAVGIVFASMAALVAQLTVSARSALGISAIVLGTTYLLRAVGDMGDSVLPWFSPFGWATEMRSFVDERWWPLALSAITGAGLVASAVATNARRDVGAGLVGDRSGASAASERLGSPFGLALRLQRAGLIAWGASLFLLGLVYGWIAGDAGHLYEDIDALKDYLARIGAGDPADQYLALTMFVSALIAAGFAIESSTRLRAEESAQRAEPILSTRVGRGRWAWSHLAIALGGSAAMLLVFGVGVGITRSIDAGEVGELPRLIIASLAYTPALWMFVGLVAALFGVAPRIVPAVWAVLGAIAFVGFIGPLLQLPDWVFDVSPLEHVSRLPVAAFSVVPELALTAIATALVAIGVFRFRRRDIVAA
jgi:polyether ionophore transport system permease protein